MAPNYSVQYAFELQDSADRPDDYKGGHGVIVLNTEFPPETAEDFRAMAQKIGTDLSNKTEPYKSVKIISYAETEEPLHKSSEDEILEGEIVV